MNQIEQTFGLDHLLKVQQQRSKRARLVALSAATLFAAGAIGIFLTSSFDEPVQAFLPSKTDASGGAAVEDKVSLHLMSFQPKNDEAELLNQKIAAQRA